MGEKILYFEANNGISGDMTLGALIHLGADVDVISEELKKMNPGYFKLIPNDYQKSGISGINLDVIVSDDSHSEEHEHHHDNEHHHDDEHHHTTYQNIKEMIESSEITDNAKKIALSIFKVIAIAEAAVHDMPLEEIAFHEVGAVDSIIDIVGSAIAIDMLGVDKIYCGPVHDGQGEIVCRHGLIPVPVPAVMEMAKRSDIPIIIDSDVKTEMVTPTGFGILEGIKAKFKPIIGIHVEKVGYGFGKRDTGRFSAVRILLGEENEGPFIAFED